MSTFESSAYINSEALMSWKSSMESINSNCLDNLDSFKSDATKLTGSWTGESASSFERQVNACMQVAANMHESMKNIDSFLETVVITSQNQ